MSAWDLPTSLEVNGTTYEIRSDFRAALDVQSIAQDAALTDEERGALALEVFYPDFEDMPPTDYADAILKMRWFLGGGDNATEPPRRKLADWEQDFPLIVPAVNRVLGYDVRSVPYDGSTNTGGVHWWTFLGAYMEIGDCLFAQVVAIRKKLSEGNKLEKWEREFYNRNRKLVDLTIELTDEEQEILDEWM